MKTLDLGDGYNGTIRREPYSSEGSYSWEVSQPPGIPFSTGWGESEEDCEAKMRKVIQDNEAAPGPSKPKQQMEAAVTQAVGQALAPPPVPGEGESDGESKDEASDDTAEDDESAESEDLNELTVADLKERARELEMSGYSSMNKDELVKAIKKEQRKSKKS